VVGLGHAIGAVPSNQASVVAQIGQTVAGGNPLFYVVQMSAAIVLALAANTSFNGFPLLAAIMAQDSFLPHQFSHRGLRLAFSNGIFVLGSIAHAIRAATRVKVADAAPTIVLHAVVSVLNCDDWRRSLG